MWFAPGAGSTAPGACRLSNDGVLRNRQKRHALSVSRVITDDRILAQRGSRQTARSESMVRHLIQIATGVVIATVMATTGSVLNGQEAPAQGTVTGTVVDAATAEPLVGATVVLEPIPTGVVPATWGGPGFLRATLARVTDESGTYLFEGLSPGTYRLLARRLGYRAQVVEIELRHATPMRVSVGLEVNPIRLEPVTSDALVQPYPRTRDVVHDPTDLARVDVELDRQRRFLASDTRSLTHADVVESVTLGETDLFRALQRFPGVTTRDDYTAELRTRGSRWSDTRVYFDGLPLFNPVHALGAFSGINPDAVGTAIFHPGVRSAAFGEGGAAVLDLESRPASGNGDVRGFGELSMLTARLAVDRRAENGRGGWMFAARRSHLDFVIAPYAMFDLTGRLDFLAGERVGIEISGLWEWDGVGRNDQDVLDGNAGGWGNRVARVSVTHPIGSVFARHTFGLSAYGANVRPPAGSAEPATNQDISYLLVGTRIEPATQTSGASWALGWDMTRQRLSYHGPGAEPFPLPLGFPPLTLEEGVDVLSVWGEHRWSPMRGLQVEGGARVSLGSDERNAHPVRLAPRLSARYRLPGSRAAVSGGIGRSYQYTQAIARAGDAQAAYNLHVTDVWRMASDTVPAMRSDIATLGGEWWLGSSWLGAVNLYWRRTTGVAVPEPATGPLGTDGPQFVSATNEAHGVEFSVRKLAGRWTTSLAYTIGQSTLGVGSLKYPAPGETRHAFDMTGMLRFSRSVRFGTAFAATSGTRFTRFQVDAINCSGPPARCIPENPRAEAPNGARSPAYVSLDFLFDWTHAFEAWTFGLYLQVRNLFNHVNAGPYTGSFECVGPRSSGTRVVRPGLCDGFDDAVPTFPVIGFRVSF